MTSAHTTESRDDGLVVPEGCDRCGATQCLSVAIRLEDQLYLRCESCGRFSWAAPFVDQSRRSLWRNTKACCELVYSQTNPARVLLWIGPRLVFEQVITSYTEAMTLAAELETAYA